MEGFWKEHKEARKTLIKDCGWPDNKEAFLERLYDQCAGVYNDIDGFCREYLELIDVDVDQFPGDCIDREQVWEGLCDMHWVLEESGQTYVFRQY